MMIDDLIALKKRSDATAGTTGRRLRNRLLYSAMENPGASAEDPRTIYRERVDARSMVAKKQARRELGIANLRLVIFLAGGVLAWLVFVSKVVPTFWLFPPVATYILLVVGHDRVIRERRRAERAADFYERGIARLDHDWIGSGAQGDRFQDADHPYAEDLDLFGRGSLFELICAARTPWGESILADWLRTPAEPATIRARQVAVDELRAKLDLREELAVLGAEVCSKTDSEQLLRWCRTTSRSGPRFLLPLGRVLSVALAATAAGWIFFGTGPFYFFVAAFLQFILALQTHRGVARVMRDVDRPGKDLAVLALVLARIEVESFVSPFLKERLTSLRTEGLPPSKRIARLGRLIEMQEWSRNYFFAIIALALNWDLELAHAIDTWRTRFGPAVGAWVQAVGEVESLVSFAGHAFEHPRDPFPTIVDRGPCFKGKDLGHPLLAESRCVRNDLCIDGETRLLVVSGSNMSGKSTLLRTVGVNAVLALAGATVCAEWLAISPLAIGAVIRSHDSLHDGTSRFYEEIKRLRRLVDITEGTAPLLFLIDEILHGTNSHDRKIGAEAIARGLVRGGGIGLITTHDLALTQVANDLAPQAGNIHFADQLVDGRIVFDYRVQPGVVRRSNAIALMRAVGLEI